MQARRCLELLALALLATSALQLACGASLREPSALVNTTIASVRPGAPKTLPRPQVGPRLQRVVSTMRVKRMA